MNSHTSWSNRQFAIFVAILMMVFVVLVAAIYDRAHWDGKRACEAVPGHIYDWGGGHCVKEAAPMN